MTEIIKAIEALYQATPALQAGLTGGYTLTHPREPKLPYAVLNVSGDSAEYDTGRNYLQDVTVSVDFYAERMGQLADLIPAWRKALTAGLELSGGRVLLANLDGEDMNEIGDGDAGEANVNYTLTVRMKQQQS